jgi:HSP20 family protein
MFSLLPWRKERKVEGALDPRVESPLGLMRREFASLFDRFFGDWPSPFEVLVEPPTYWGLEMEDGEKEVVIKAELPGFEPAEIEVLITGEMLKIKAEHKEKGKEKEEEALVRKVERSITLPAGTEASKVEARYHSGVLEIHLPKLPEAEARRIEVKT